MKLKSILISLFISTAGFILVFFITYNLACIISLPYFVEDNGEKHSVMPIGQTIIGIIFGALMSIILLLICYKKFKKKDN